jgi:hypothetical protein
MADLNKLARNSAMLNGTTPYMKTGSSRYDEGLKKQYFADQTRLYTQEIGPAASNVYDAMCQGVSENGDWYDWRKVRIRVSPAATSSTGETMPDDWQKLHIIKPVSIDTVPIGAYLTFAGNTWIVYKGKNMGSVIGDGIIRRCNSVINVLDWYGNLVAVPMSYAKMGTLGNASHATENSIVAKNYISCICQLNEYSAAFQENTRIILGKTAYTMRGLNDFTREFTDDQESVHLLTFTIERSAPLPQDSIEKQCADYHSFRWDIGITGTRSMTAGGTQKLSVKSTRMGETVISGAEHPISYLFSSSNERVATVDSEGNVSAVGVGSAVITVTLQQNTEISQTMTLAVTAAESGASVGFTTSVPETLGEYETALIRAAKFLNGAEQSGEVAFTFSGPSKSCYGVEQVEENAYRVTCYGASNVPLVVTISDGEGNSESLALRLTTGTTDNTDYREA